MSFTEGSPEESNGSLAPPAQGVSGLQRRREALVPQFAVVGQTAHRESARSGNQAQAGSAPQAGKSIQAGTAT